MIEQGQIQETQERTVGPMTAVISQYKRSQIKQQNRADRRIRPLLPKERQVIGYAAIVIGQLENLNESLERVS